MSVPPATHNAVFVMVLDPRAFAGHDLLLAGIRGLVATRHAATGPGRVGWRPGVRAPARRRRALREGVEVARPLLDELLRRAAALGVAPPAWLPGPAPD